MLHKIEHIWSSDTSSLSISVRYRQAFVSTYQKKIARMDRGPLPIENHTIFLIDWVRSAMKSEMSHKGTGRPGRRAEMRTVVTAGDRPTF
ncbi:hypothetical protein VTP01DRAFT_6627, partial [Rhizomucor pusillus]|uniref:uncharacterized protein n=1 Tax=Rhizomucor pusillus TaxID=4840 RepID=UPI0037437A27